MPWTEYFEDLLKRLRVASTDTCDSTDFGKEEILTMTEVEATIRGLKFRNAADEDEIRPEMLKLLNGEEVGWLTRVCQVARKFGKIPKDVIIPLYKKGDCKECTNYGQISLLAFQEGCISSAVKQNTKR